MTTLQQIRDIVTCNEEILGLETTVDMLRHGNYKFPTDNWKTIERTFYEVRDERRLVRETELRVKKEFQSVAVVIAICFFVIGVGIGKVFM